MECQCSTFENHVICLCGAHSEVLRRHSEQIAQRFADFEKQVDARLLELVKSGAGPEAAVLAEAIAPIFKYARRLAGQQ